MIRRAAGRFTGELFSFLHFHLTDIFYEHVTHVKEFYNTQKQSHLSRVPLNHLNLRKNPQLNGLQEVNSVFTSFFRALCLLT